jgi:pyruvate/2-oxoglutarate/acetoin dehydrogenase E1 component
VEEVTQPQGHSTSGSHERYKSPERLEWEREWDCLRKMREWIIANFLSTDDELSEIESAAKHLVRECRQEAFHLYTEPMKHLVEKTVALVGPLLDGEDENAEPLRQLARELSASREPMRRDIIQLLSRTSLHFHDHPQVGPVIEWLRDFRRDNEKLYNTHLYHEGPKSPLMVEERPAEYAEDTTTVNGYEILNRFFDQLFANNPRVLAFGEDVGRIGDVNQGFAGLQAKHGEHRIFDTSIREVSIMGQGIGLALRGLRPIAEIQYLDYLLYGLQPLSDDLSTLHFRTVGKQSAPLIVRTRGHRLEGIWHSGSPMGLVINSLRGMHVCVPRNMTQAAGMYNTLLDGNDPAIVIECLNGYRLKEKMPANLSEMRVPLGIPEVIREGTDITVVSYGSVLRQISEAAVELDKESVSLEIIDVRTLLPFDRHGLIGASLRKTNRILFVDEDVPGGAAAYMYNMVIEKQDGYRWLDVAPRTLTGSNHRPGYGSDGDYFSKPNTEQIIEAALAMMRE